MPFQNEVTASVGARGPERNAPEASVGLFVSWPWRSNLVSDRRGGGIFPAPPKKKSAPYDSNPAFGGTPGPGSTWPLRRSFFQRTKPKRCKKYLQRSPSPFPLPVGERGRGEGKRSPQVMFSNRGEEQFAPHETMAVEHFAEIFFAPGG